MQKLEQYKQAQIHLEEEVQIDTSTQHRRQWEDLATAKQEELSLVGITREIYQKLNKKQWYYEGKDENGILKFKFLGYTSPKKLRFLGDIVPEEMYQASFAFSVEAPKATKVNVFLCKNLTHFDAPEATEVDVYHCTQQVVDALITSVKPGNLIKFEVDGEDITQDIKEAYRELDSSDTIPEKRNNLTMAIRPKIGVPNAALYTAIYGNIGQFLTSHEIGNLSRLNKKSLSGRNSKNFSGVLDEIAKCKKDKIAEKTHAHTAAREAVNSVLGGVFNR